MVVNASFSAKTVPEFIAYARANPGKVNMASAGIGATSHVAGEMFKAMAGINLVHIPYRGEAPVIADLLGDQVQVYFGGVGAIENVRTGNLRALAVTTATRSQVLPEILAVTEYVPGYEASVWYGVGVPKNTPADIVDKLNKEINAGLADSNMKARVADLGGTVLAGTPADFGHRRRNRKVGQGDPRGRHQAGMSQRNGGDSTPDTMGFVRRCPAEISAAAQKGPGQDGRGFSKTPSDVQTMGRSFGKRTQFIEPFRRP
jgi:Tripartite tricarboxylate transporter family receptor